jgi:hypothetical protein
MGLEIRFDATSMTSDVLSTAEILHGPARRDDFPRISRRPLHRCNTHPTIEDESRFRMRSSLVIRVAEDQDKFTSKDPDVTG